MTGTTTAPATTRGNGLIAVVFAAVAVAAALTGAGYAAAWLSRSRMPQAGLAGAAKVLTHPDSPAADLGSPGLNPVAYWAVAAVILAACAALAFFVWRLVRRPLNPRTDAHSVDGIAARAEIVQAAGAKAIRRQAATVRPSLEHPLPKDAGYLLGRARGVEVWASIEDSMLLVGPPRSGKGKHIVINAVLDAPGAVVTTSTRPDTLAVTLKARKDRGGPVAVFDPQGLAHHAGPVIRWSPVRGCQDPATAMIRAAGLASAFKYGDVENGGFWQAKTRTVIQCMLHAAALDHRGATELYRWATSPAAAVDAVHILASHPGAAPGWAQTLESTLQSDPRTRDSVWHGVTLAFDPLADPRVLAAVSPSEGESLDPQQFLSENGTLYLLATGSGASASAPLVAALIEDVVEVARLKAAHSPRARLDPPLLLALDEIGNMSPLPSLPTLMAEGGGTGITVLPVLQSMAQARAAWGEQKAAAIWDAAIVKILLGGGSLTRDIQDVAHLLGERDEIVTTTSWDGAGQPTRQQALRRVPVLSSEAIRTLPFGTGLVLLRTARPIIADLRPWTSRPDAKQLQAAQFEYENEAGPLARLNEPGPALVAPAGAEPGTAPTSDGDVA